MPAVQIQDAEFGVVRKRVSLKLTKLGTFRVTQEIIDQFARASADNNPLHVSPEVAARGPYGRTIAHGFLLAARVADLAKEMRPFELFPDANCALAHSNIDFVCPVLSGKEVACWGRLASVRRKGRGVSVRFDWRIEVGTGKIAANGTFRLFYSRRR